MTTFTSNRCQGELGKKFSEETRWFNLDISPSTLPNHQTDWYQVIDSKKTWKNNGNWTRIIKRRGERINFANKSQMTPFDREVELYINQTYPIPTE
jgi:hypothetical protein